jgi:competence protein ComEA
VPDPVRDGGAPTDPAAGLPPGGAPDGAWQERLALLTSGGGPRPTSRLGAAVAAGVAVVAAVVVLRGPQPPPPEVQLPMAAPLEASSTTTTAPDVVVHVAGAVARPGLAHLPGGARVADAVEAAGGARPEADLGRVNLAAVLADGQRLYVPAAGEAVPAVEGGADAGGGGGAAGGAPALVDVNTADAGLLETLPGVGPATSAAILDERERRGRFATVDDLLDVRGIGPAKLEALRDRVVVS